MKRLISLSVISMFTLFMVSCSSHLKKSQLPVGMSNDQLIQQTEQLKQIARTSHADVLAKDYFDEGDELLIEAHEVNNDNEKAQEVREKLAFAQSYFKEAIKKSTGPDQQYEDVLNARFAAINAGAMNFEQTQEKINEVDSDFIDQSDEFYQPLDALYTAKLQQDYLDTEVMAIQETQLGKAKELISKLKDKGADYKAPQTLNQAEKSILLAENIIAKSPRDMSVYEDAVTTALKDTVLLNDVMNVIAKVDEDTPETAALKIVDQQRQIADIERDVNALRSTVIGQAGTIAFEKRLELIKEQFGADEAEVYQQGAKVIIRLRNINFKVGDAKIPANATATLDKVRVIANDLGADAIEVQGHTDSSGSNETNLKLSQERAYEVANYLEKEGSFPMIGAVGYGEEKPIANNESNEGRSLNRRVDIVIDAQNVENMFSE